MKNSEIRELATKELIERIEGEKNFLTRQKLNHTVSPLENPLKVRETRRNIARLMTELRKRQLQSESESN
ncbi:50S ribosomal protein L29 [Bacteroidota bacterium]